MFDFIKSLSEMFGSGGAGTAGAAPTGNPVGNALTNIGSVFGGKATSTAPQPIAPAQQQTPALVQPQQGKDPLAQFVQMILDRRDKMKGNPTGAQLGAAMPALQQGVSDFGQQYSIGGAQTPFSM